MEEGRNEFAEDAVRGAQPASYLALLRRQWWKIALVSLAAGIATLILMLQLPNIFRASATITPSIDENKQNVSLGVLASFGVAVGGPTKLEDLETLFRSNDLTVRVFRKYPLWGIVLPDRYDPATGRLRPSWTDRIFGNVKTPGPPDDWDAIRAVKDRLVVAVNKRAGTVSLSFESPSAEGSAKIVNYYLEEGKSRLQEEAFERANRNKRFIQEQISKTIDALTRDRLYSLYGQEVEREMLARNREQFGFRVVDASRAPDRKFKPHRAKGAIAATALFFFLACGYFLARGRK